MFTVDLVIPSSRFGIYSLRNRCTDRGGVQGLRLLYPRVTPQTAHEYAEDLRQYLASTHGVTFMEAHDNQWCLCNFQKSVNARYNRKPPMVVVKDAVFFSMIGMRR